MKKFFQTTFSSIPVSLIGWFLLFTIILIIAGYSDYRYNRNSMRNEKFAEMKSVSSLKHDQIIIWLKERRSEARFIKDNPQFNVLFTTFIQTYPNPNLEIEIREWLKPLVLNHEYSEIYFLDSDFEPVMAFYNSTDLFYSQLVKETEFVFVPDTIITTDLFDTPDGNPGIFNIVPFYDTLTNELIGSLALKIDASTQLYPLLLNPVIGKSHETYLVRINSDSIHYLSPLKYLTIIPFRFALPLTRSEVSLSKYTAGETFLTEGHDYRGEKVLTFMKKIDFSSLFLVSEVDQYEIFSQIYKRARNTMIFIAVLILLTGFVLFYIWKAREVRFVRKIAESHEETVAILKQYEHLTKYANDIILLISPKGRIIWCNEKAIQTFGYSESELTKLNIRDLRITENHGQVAEFMRKVREADGLIYETEYLRKNGEIFPVEVSSRYIEVDGKFFYQSIIRDISDKKEKEKALRLAHRTLSYHIHNTPLAFVEWDKEFRVSKWSSQAENLFGWKADEVLGKNPGEWKFVYDDDESNVQIVMDDLIKNNIKRNTSKNRNFSKSGVVLHCTWFNSVLTDDSGELISILSLVQDITEQVVTKNELERAFQKNNMLLKTAGDGIMGLDKNGALIFLNPAGEEILGFKESELYGKEIHDIVHRPHKQLVADNEICPVLESLSTGASFSDFRDVFYTKEKQPIPVEFASNPITENDEITGSVIVFKDISEKLKQEEELEESRENLAITLNSIGDAVITTNNKGIITGMNPVAEKLTDWKKKQAVGLEVNKVFRIRSTFDGQPLIDPVRKVLETGKFVGLANHTELISKKGCVYQIADSAAPIKKDDGGIQGVVMVFRDVTDKYLQERILRDSEEKFRNLFETATDGLFLMRDDIIIDCNISSVKIFGGKAKADLVGKSVLKFSPKFQSEGIASSILAKQYILFVKEGKNQKFEWIHKKLDGTLIETEITLNLTTFAQENVIQASLRDITERKEAERELKQWADIFQNTKMGIVIGGPDGKYLNILNPAFAEMHGFTVEELTGKEILSVFAEGEREKVPEIIQLAHKTGYHQCESIHLKKDGTTFPVFLTLNAVKDKNGNVLYRIVNVQDISERKKAEQEIELLYEISTLLNSTNDLNSAVEVVLHKICETFDWDYGEAWFPHSNEKLLSHSREYYVKTPDLNEFAQQNIKISMKFGEGLPGRAWALKDLVWYKDISIEKDLKGRNMIVEAGLASGFAIPVITGNNTIAVLVFYVKKWLEKDDRIIKLVNSIASHIGEVLQRKWAEGEIRKLSVALDQSPVAVEISNTIGTIEFANKRYYESTGLQPQEVIGRDAGFIGLRETNKEKYQDLLETIRNGETWSGELLNKNEAGEYFWEKLIISPVKDVNGKVGHFITLKENISERKTLEQELTMAKELAEEASRLKSAILMNMSHEIRTPLNGILGFSQILQSRIQDEEGTVMVNMIQESGERLLHTLSALVEISSLESQPRVDQKEVEVHRLVENAMEDFRLHAGEKNLYLRNEVPLNIKIITDGEKLSQALKYTIDNAIKFTEKGGVTISFVQEQVNDKPGFTISICDTGIGIRKETIPKLFEPFWQLSHGHERTHEGTGIGLAIVKKIVTLLAGNVSVDSKPGKGTCFRLSFPLPVKEEPEYPRDEKIETVIETFAAGSDKKPKVLIVEDNQVNARLMKMQLEECCETDLVFDGRSAIDKTKTNGYDIILMDINLGSGIDGVQATQEIRKSPNYSHTPIVAVTGYTLPSDKKKFLKGGLTHFLPKPFTREQIVKLIRSVIRNKS